MLGTTTILAMIIGFEALVIIVMYLDLKDLRNDLTSSRHLEDKWMRLYYKLEDDQAKEAFKSAFPNEIVEGEEQPVVTAEDYYRDRNGEGSMPIETGSYESTEDEAEKEIARRLGFLRHEEDL